MEKMASPYENFLGMYIVEKEEGRGKVKIGLPYRKELCNPMGTLHGGAIASLADTAAVQAIRTLVPSGLYLTVGLSVQYKNPAKTPVLFAQAQTAHLRGKIFKSVVEIIDSEGTLCAEAEVTSYLPKWEAPAGPKK
ncbi:MAG: PaaI family thioesterase [Candidatus Omnitrophota bacterium]